MSFSNYYLGNPCESLIFTLILQGEYSSDNRVSTNVYRNVRWEVSLFGNLYTFTTPQALDLTNGRQTASTVANRVIEEARARH